MGYVVEMSSTTETRATGNTSRSVILDAFRRAGEPLATVYVPTPSDRADAEHRLDIRRQNVVSELRSAGATDRLVEVLEAMLADRSHGDGEAVVLVGSESGPVLSRAMVRPVGRTIVSTGFTPLLLPMLAATQADVDHLAVLVDRTGAEIWTRSGLADPLDAATVEGDEVHVHRGHPGGWSQRRFQQRAENTWQANAKLVADEVASEGHDGSQLIVVGGDVRAVGFLVEYLPTTSDIIEVDGSRSADHDRFLDAVDRAVRTVAAERLRARIRALTDAIGEGRGAEGPEVLELASQGRVDTLYVVDDSFAPDRPTGRFDFSVPMSVASDIDWTVSDAVEAPVTEGAIALAVGTGASVVVLPGAGLPGVPSPLGAILRG